MCKIAVALVDYDNVKATREDRSPGDVLLNLHEIVNTLVLETQRIEPMLGELLVRVYGGWVDEAGRFSSLAEWVLGALPSCRGRFRRVVVKPTLATALACRSDEPIVGTYRANLPPSGRRGQKMVDHLLALDAVFFAASQALPVILFSDDDDFVPAALAVPTMARDCRLHWLRRRTPGEGLNDASVGRAGVTFGSAGHYARL